MAQFPGLSLTVQGNKMILRSSTGKTEDRLIITKAVIGDGQLTTSVDNLTAIISKKLEVGLSEVKEVKNGHMLLQFNFDNRKVENGFYWREVGLYAKNGDSGEEKLIAYSNAKGLTSYIPDKNNVIPMQRLVIALGVGDNPNAKGELDFASTITLEQLESEISKHNTDPNAHENRFKALEQTTQSLISTLNNALSKKYDKTGGTLSGDIVFTGNNRLIRTDGNSGGLQIYSSNRWQDGAHINLASSNAQSDDIKGSFSIVASANNTYKYLIGRTNGQLTWDGDELIRKSMLATRDDTSALSQAPTLQLVKSLLKSNLEDIAVIEMREYK
ncbi:hypothetical protein [Veillonella montpellierensis]|uniref:hypothetical protein n=1 Tax=Veillonella montpellierensis TaxID=187328 RepID=UPI0023F76489|nr:hypothetical protein [Veillonella montpellierensis]